MMAVGLWAYAILSSISPFLGLEHYLSICLSIYLSIYFRPCRWWLDYGPMPYYPLLTLSKTNDIIYLSIYIYISGLDDGGWIIGLCHIILYRPFPRLRTLTIYLTIYLSTYIFQALLMVVGLWAYAILSSTGHILDWSNYLSIFLSIYLSFCLSIYLSVYLSIYIF